MYKIENLSFQYYQNHHLSLNHLDFSIEKNDFVCLVGQSGSGKSTLLRLLMKELMPSGKMWGLVLLNGKPIQENDEIKIGFLFQNPNHQLVMDKVWHELAFGLENQKMPYDLMKQRVAEIVNYFNLQSIYEQPVGNLSEGQKQIINLASIMAMNPEVILLDEPTARLDPIMKEQFIHILKQIHDDFGTTIVIAEHHLEEMIPLCNKMLILDQGKQYFYGNLQEAVHKIIKEQHPLIEALPEYMRLSKEYPLLTKQEARQYINRHTWHKIGIKPQNEVKERLLSVKDLSLSYPHKKVIKSLNMNIYNNEILCLLGANGAGKSTLLYHLYHSYGKKSAIYYQNHWITQEENRKIGLLPQNPEILFSKDTIREELLIDNRIDKALNYLEMFNLTFLLESHPYDLSGGQQQLLALIKVLLKEPEILLLDEPTIAIDAFMKKKLGGVLRKLQALGLTILCVSHDLDFCIHYSDRCGLLFDGKAEGIVETRLFFKHNLFYTTTLSKLFKKTDPDILMLEDIDYEK